MYFFKSPFLSGDYFKVLEAKLKPAGAWQVLKAVSYILENDLTEIDTFTVKRAAEVKQDRAEKLLEFVKETLKKVKENYAESYENVSKIYSKSNQNVSEISPKSSRFRAENPHGSMRDLREEENRIDNRSSSSLPPPEVTTTNFQNEIFTESALELAVETACRLPRGQYARILDDDGEIHELVWLERSIRDNLRKHLGAKIAHDACLPWMLGHTPSAKRAVTEWLLRPLPERMAGIMTAIDTCAAQPLAYATKILNQPNDELKKLLKAAKAAYEKGDYLVEIKLARPEQPREPTPEPRAGLRDSPEACGWEAYGP